MKYVRERLLGFWRRGVCLTRVLRVAAWKMDSWTGFWRKSCAMRVETSMFGYDSGFLRAIWCRCIGVTDTACYDDAYLMT